MVPTISALAGLAASALLAGCLGPRDLDGASDPLVVTKQLPDRGSPQDSPERAAAVAEMRAKAELGDALPYPDVFQTAQTTRLAARPEPKPVDEVTILEAELAELATKRRASINTREIAELEARADELRRLLAAARAGFVSR